MGQTNKKLYILIYLALALTTIVAFEGVRHNEFVFDDTDYVKENTNVNQGITLDSVIWSFTSSHSSNWHPLTWLSHMLDCQIFGLKPAGHHLVNLFFHIVNTLLLFTVLKKMTSQPWCSAFVAAAFALHPLHVESVAWISERKDVLSGFFWMLTIAAYIRYVRRPDVRKYLLVVLVFCLGLLAKPMLVTLPCVLLLLDFWPLERLRWNTDEGLGPLSCESSGINCRKLSPVQLIVEKVPLFVLSAASSIVTFFAQKGGGSIEKIEHLPVNLRIANAFVCYARYISKMILPNRLAVFYPHPSERLALWQTIVFALILIGVSAAIIYLARRYRFLLTGWFLFLGTLVPVIGIVQVGGQAMADRYTYLPSIGFFIIVSWGASKLFAKLQYRKILLSTTAAVVCIAWLLCTRTQVKYWQNDFTLYGHALTVTDNNHIMHYNFANVLCQIGLYDKAVKHFQATIKIAPKYQGVRNKLGMAYYLCGKTKQAIECWNEQLKLEPKHINAMNNLAWLRATHKNPDLRDPNQALELALSACELTDYNQPYILDALAASYAANRRFPEAVDTAEKAIKSAKAEEKNQLAEQIQRRLDLYKASQPYIDSAQDNITQQK